MLCRIHRVVVDMKYPKLKSDEPKAYLYDDFSLGIGAQDSRIVDVKNMYCEDMLLKTRGGLYTDETRIIDEFEMAEALNFKLTNSSIFYNDEFCRLGVVQETDDYSYMKFMFYIFGATGIKKSFGEIYFGRITSEKLEFPELNFAFSGQPTAADGIYAIFSYPNTKNIFIYEYSIKQDDWIRLSLHDAYKPLYYKNGRGTFYRNADGEYEAPVYNEPINMLNPHFVVTYTTDGVSNEFRFPRGNFTLSEGDYIDIEFEDIDKKVYSWRIQGGNYISESHSIGDANVCITLNPFSTGITFFSDIPYTPTRSDFNPNNLKLTFYIYNRENIERIKNMSCSMWYGSGTSGSRLCLAGNRYYPSLICIGAPDKALYFPVDNQFYVGDPNQSITAISRQNKSLIIFKEREIYSCLYASGKFSITNIHSSLGCDIPATMAMCDNRLVWTNKNGCVYMLATLSQYSVTAVYKLSDNITHLLENENAIYLTQANACSNRNKYMLFIGNRAYIMDYKKSARKNSREFVRGLSWYIWEYPETVNVLCAVSDGTAITLLCDTQGRKRKYYLCGLLDGVGVDAFFNHDSLEKRPILSYLKTDLKADESEYLKIYSDIYIRLYAQDDIQVNYIDSRGDTVGRSVINIEYTEKDNSRAYRLLPMLKAQGLGIKIDFSGAARLEGIVFYCKKLSKIR